MGSNTTSYQDTGLSASTTYYYRVRASNLDGHSGYSNVVNYAMSKTGMVGLCNVAALESEDFLREKVRIDISDTFGGELGFFDEIEEGIRRDRLNLLE